MFWLVVIHMAAADTVSASPSHDAPAQNLPHGILAPTAYPARNIGIESRRAPAFELPPGDQGYDLSPAQLKESEGLFGPNPLGPPNPRERMNFAPQLPGYPGPLGPPPFQRAPKELTYELPGVVGGVLDGSPAFRQEMERLSRLAEPQPNRPMIRPGQDYPVGIQQGLPMNPWYGLPVPTSNAMGPVAMGPYFQRRPKQSYFPSTASVPLAPLRDIEHSTRLFDSWLDEQVRGRGPRRPRPELGPLVPPSIPRGNHGDHQGKMFAPRYSKERLALVSQEKVYVSQGTRPTYATRGLLPDLTETTPRAPPPLLDDEGGLEEPAPASDDDAGLEEPPGSEDVSLFSRERKQLSALRQASNTVNALLL